MRFKEYLSEAKNVTEKIIFRSKLTINNKPQMSVVGWVIVMGIIAVLVTVGIVVCDR